MRQLVTGEPNTWLALGAVVSDVRTVAGVWTADARRLPRFAAQAALNRTQLEPLSSVN